MPTWFPSYTNCSSPSGWYKAPWASVISIVIAGAWFSGGLALAAGLSTAIAVFLANVCLGGILYCTWWLNVRLICLGGDRSAVGVIYHLELPVPGFDAFNLPQYDTDYSFNLLLYPFIPQDEIPAAYVAEQWSPTADITIITAGNPNVNALVQVPLILPQQTLASLNLNFGGQDVNCVDEPDPQPTTGSSQHFLLHCEIEGPGIHDLRILLYVLFGVFLAAAALNAIPGIGTILSWIVLALAFLAFLIAGAAIRYSDASPPAGGGWGGSFNAYESVGSDKDPVDVGYVFGRWVYDTLHATGSNELHPLHFMIKIGQTTKGNLKNGDWELEGGDPLDIKAMLDTLFGIINSPAARQAQSQPENQWSLHPLLDGCQGLTPIPTPSAPIS